MFIAIFFLLSGVGFGIACLIVAGRLHKSNDIGNSTGGFSDYAATDIYYVCSEDNVRRSSMDAFISGLGDPKNWN